jgi:hypothetical protein
LGFEKSIDWKEKSDQSGGDNDKADKKKFMGRRRLVGSDSQLDRQGIKSFLLGDGDFLIKPDRIAGG